MIANDFMLTVADGDHWGDILQVALIVTYLLFPLGWQNFPSGWWVESYASDFWCLLPK